MVTGKSVHGAKDADEIVALHGQQLAQRGAAVFLVVGENHGPHVRQTVFGKEHVLGAAQADAFGAERPRLQSIARNVGVGAHSHAAEGLGPAHELQQFGIVGPRGNGVELAVDDAAGGAVERNPVALFQHLAVDAHLAGLLVHVDVAGAGDAALAHAASDHGGVAGHAATRGQNAGRDFHAADVFRRGFAAHQDQLRAAVLVELLHRFVGGEDDLSDRRARRCRQSGREHFDLLALLVEARHQEVVKLVGLDAEDGFFLRDQPFLHHLDGDANRGATGALAVARLQHVQAAVLDGELEVLHVAIVFFQPRGDFAQLVVDVGLDLLQFGDVYRGANAGDHVFALRVHQELAVELLHAGRGIAGEAHAGAAGLAQVAEDHGLHVDGGAQHVVNVVDAAIGLGAIVEPGAEHGIARHHQLLVRVLRKLALGVLLHDLLVFGDDFLQRLGVEIGVELGLLLLLLAVEDFFERVLGNVEHDGAEHLNQAAIGVVGEARIVAALGQALDRLVVQAEVEDGVHHAGHGELCARAHADQQRIVGAAQLLPLQLFQAAKRLVHLAIDFFGDRAGRACIRGRLRSGW